MQEFRVESSSYPAEFGTGTGGQVSVITKSGGNQFHGAVFEYLRNDAARRARTTSTRRATSTAASSPQRPKSPLKQNQFGGSIGGPLVKDRAFFFGSYEGYRLDAGLNFVEAVPSAAAWARAVPAVAALRPGFTAPGAVILPGASTNPDFDIAQLQDDAERHGELVQRPPRLQDERELVDLRPRVPRPGHERPSRRASPAGASHFTANPTNAVFNLQGLLGGGTINEFKFGYNAAPSTYRRDDAGRRSRTSLIQPERIGGQHRHRRPGRQRPALASPGGLVRVNSAGNGRGAPYDPYSLTFADSLSRCQGNHFMKFGADVRADPDDDRSARRHHLHLREPRRRSSPTRRRSIQYFGDLSEPSPFHNGATGPKHIKQEYYVGFAQDEWRVRPNFTLNYGLRYDYYAPLHGSRQPDRQVQHRHRRARSGHDAVLPVEEEQLPAARRRRPSRRRRRRCFAAAFGIFVGPGQTEDQIQPIEAERISTTLSSGALIAFPIDPAAIRAELHQQPEQPVVSAARLLERLHAAREGLPVHGVGAAGARRAAWRRRSPTSAARDATCSCAASPTGPSACSRTAPAPTQIREFDIVTRNADGTHRHHPAAVRRNRLQDQRRPRQLQRDAAGAHPPLGRTGVAMNAQYTLGYSKGNTGGSNEAATAGNNARRATPARRLRLRQRLQQLRRPPHVQPQRALHDPGQRAAHRRMVDRRHRQRAQRPADSGR